LKPIEVYFMWLITYSVIGWMCETLVCSFKAGKFTNRGLLSSPYCISYGIGALVNAILYAQLNNPVLTFVFGTIVAFVISYLTSYISEKISGVKICDRASQKVVVGNHASVLTSAVFGVLSVVQVMFLHPVIEAKVDSIHPSLLRLIFVLLGALLAIDLIASYTSLRKIKENIDNFHYHCKHELRKDVDDIEKAKRSAAAHILSDKQNKLVSAYPVLEKTVYPAQPIKKAK